MELKIGGSIFANLWQAFGSMRDSLIKQLSVDITWGNNISKTDPYVPNELSLKFANNIGAEVKLVDDAGHFNTSAGFTEFDELLRELI